ncbi:hypothetical protein [Nonomuraea turcica]|nr:hypothetical protein [Nonomuraea sp. G32]MDP4510348.1 hypothetical protein [Nonomuraea sp. G32]
MAEEKDDRERQRCGTCLGAGGEWIEKNGDADSHDEWVPCSTCGGSGWQ